jgi:SPP1 family phage portal protein
LSSQMQNIVSLLQAGAASVMSLEQIIHSETRDWLFCEERQWMFEGQKYYIGFNDILMRKRMVIGPGGTQVEDVNLANNRIVHVFLRKLVDQKLGYLLGKPLAIQTEKPDYSDLLKKIFDKSFLRKLNNIGKGWLHPHYDENGNLCFKIIPAQEIIPLWRDIEHTDLEAAIRAYDIVTYEGTQKMIVTKVEYWDHTGIRRYVLEQTGLVPDVELGEFSPHFTVVMEQEEKQFNWERVPFICFKYNQEELPLIRTIKSLIDEYDKGKSDNANNLEDLPNSIYVVKNYDGTDLGEFRKNLAVYRTAKVTDDGGIDTIGLQLDSVAFKTHMDMLRKDIYEFGRGVDTQADKLGNSPSGVSLKFHYADLDMDCNSIETEFQAGLEQLLWFVNQHIANTTGKDYSAETVDTR